MSRQEYRPEDERPNRRPGSMANVEAVAPNGPSAPQPLTSDRQLRIYWYVMVLWGFAFVGLFVYEALLALIP